MRFAVPRDEAAFTAELEPELLRSTLGASALACIASVLHGATRLVECEMTHPAMVVLVCQQAQSVASGAGQMRHSRRQCK